MQRNVATSLVLIMLLSSLAGCLDFNDEINENTDVDDTDSTTEMKTTNAYYVSTSSDAICDSERKEWIYYIEDTEMLMYCNGSTLSPIGSTIPTSIIDVVDATPADCATGGVTIIVGTDDNKDGQLNENEKDTDYHLCNGQDGMNGADGSDGQNGADGNDGVDGTDGLNGADGVNGVDAIGCTVIALHDSHYNSIVDCQDSMTYRHEDSSKYSWVEIGNYQASPKGCDMGEDECEGYAEIVTYDSDSNTAFYVNAVDSSVDMISLTDPSSPTMLQRIDVSSYGEPNSIAINNGVVAMAVANGADDMANGYILTYSTNGTFLNSYTAGVLPDMITFTHSGEYILSANEGQPNDDYDIDPEGSVTVVEVATGTVTQIDFTSFNNDRQTLIDEGVRLYANPGFSTVAQDLEPEYITVSTDDSTAYVIFQENNAFGMIDLGTMTLSSIVALGTKDYSEGCYDFSDKDGGVVLTCGAPVSSMYMPDAISLFNADGEDYILTANEGDSREYEGDNSEWTDEGRADDLVLNATHWAEMGYDSQDQSDLLEKENLGRLKVSLVDGDHDGDGQVEEIVGFGARSMSIWNSNGELVFDTGDDLTMITQNYNEYLNPYTASRNDDKGSEPEGITSGTYGDRTYAFLGLERAGGIAIYDITNPTNAHFDQYLTFADHVSPEGVTFVPSSESPTNQPLLLIANEVSGTIAIASPVHLSDGAKDPVEEEVGCFAADTGAHLAIDCEHQYTVMGDSDVHWQLVGEYDSGLGEGASEIPAYDAASQRAFVVNAVAGSVDILDLSTPAHPILVHRIVVNNGEPNSVAVHDGIVAVAVAGTGEEGSGMSKQDAGFAVFMDTDGNAIATVSAGALPDMITFTPDGSAALVANEGEPNDSYTNDPEGSVSYIDLTNGVSSLTQSDVTHIYFRDFESQLTALQADGVRIFGPGANVSQDLEPEYIAVSSDGLTAMVVLQENNALAEIDLSTKTVTAIHALGFKNYSTGMYDFSDKDDGVNFANYNGVFGMFMPDAMSSFTINGETFYVTANEGDARDYWFDAADETECLAAGGLEYDDDDGCLAYSEEMRLDDFDLDDTTFPDEDELLHKTQLGRLKTTTANNCGDTDDDGDLDFVCSYGARSFTIWDSNGDLVWDSGDQISHLVASNGEWINGYTGSRNDDKGAEPEGITVGQAYGNTYAFVGLERAGGIMIFDISNPNAPVFNQYVYLPDHVSPEGLAFVSGADSPNGAPMLIVAHEVSGTIAILQPLFV